MNKTLTKITLILAAITTISCSQKNNPHHNGYLAKLSPEQKQSLAESGAKIEVLDSTSNLYKVQGLSENEITKKAPGLKLTKNLILSFRPLDTNARDINELVPVSGEKSIEVIQEITSNTCNQSFYILSREKLGYSSNFDRNDTTFKEENRLKASISKDEAFKDLELYSFIRVFKEDSLKQELIVSNNFDYPITQFSLITLYQVIKNTSNGKCYFKIEVVSNQEAYPDYLDTVEDHNQEVKTTYFDLIELKEAQLLSKGDGVEVAVIDTGVDYNHPDLHKNILLNKKEIPSNGIDDDNNGYIDDYLGMNFIDQNLNPYDDEGHGTHVAGLVASNKVGVAPNSKILPIKSLDQNGSGDLASIYSGIKYAIDRNVDIINLSLGVSIDMPEEIRELMRRAEKKNILVVTAAGNSKKNTDIFPSIFKSTDSKNILSVVASTLDGQKASYTNYGLRTTSLAAPGGDFDNKMFSTMPTTFGGFYQELSGTSMASPVAAGVAALVMSKNPYMNAEEVKKLLIRTSKKSENFFGLCQSEGIVNARRAMRAL